MICTHKTAVISATEPAGLFSAFKILDNYFSQTLLVSEKRLTSSPKFAARAECSMAMQFHRKFLFPDVPEMTAVCPLDVLKEKKVSNKLKGNNLDHISIKNAQPTLLDKIDKHYRGRFFLASTDCRHGTGINRRFHSTIRLCEDKTTPKKTIKNLVTYGYAELNSFSERNIFNSTISYRDWIISKKDKVCIC